MSNYILNKLYGSTNVLASRTTQYNVGGLEHPYLQNDLIFLSRAGDLRTIVGVALTNPAAGLNGAYTFMEASDANDIYISMPIPAGDINSLNVWKSIARGTPLYCSFNVASLPGDPLDKFVYIMKEPIFQVDNTADPILGQTLYVNTPDKFFIGYYESYEDYGVFRIKVKLRPYTGVIPPIVFTPEGTKKVK